MNDDFDWRGTASKLAASLKPHSDKPVTLRSIPHGGAYSKAVPLVTEQQVRDMDETMGAL